MTGSPLPAALTLRVRAAGGRWVVTGAAGFVGSHLVQTLLELDQDVVAIDNFATGRRTNLDDVARVVGPARFARLTFHEGDITDAGECATVMEGATRVLHQAALGSVPRSLRDPLATHHANVNGTLQVFLAARAAGVERIVYAASSSSYGDAPGLPKVEDRVGRPLSPYALTKRINELYAEVFARCYGFSVLGLRYFNVFGPRQDPDGPYAAVIPRWIAQLLSEKPCGINGDGETSRDFTYIANVVAANLLAALAPEDAAGGEIYNVAAGERTTLNALYGMLRDGLAARHHDRPGLRDALATYGDERPGDVRHSLADISKARARLGFEPLITVKKGIDATLDWYDDALA